MPKTLSSLQLSQVDQRLAPWRRMANDVPAARRVAARDPQSAGHEDPAQLAGRLGVAQQAIANFERNEAAGKITLQSLQRVAQALDLPRRLCRGAETSRWRKCGARARA